MSTDRFTVQMVVTFIGVASVLIISGIILLAYLGREVPEPLSTLGGAAIGALGTLLARTSTADRRGDGAEAVPVEVKNSPGEPVPVTAEAGAEENQH